MRRRTAFLMHMKVDFMYSTDFLAMNAPELSHTCMHLLCTAGEGSFVFNERCYHIVKNDLVVIPMPARVSNIAAHADMQVEWFAAGSAGTYSRPQTTPPACCHEPRGC